MAVAARMPDRLSQRRKTTYATATIGKCQLGVPHRHIGLEGYANGATRRPCGD